MKEVAESFGLSRSSVSSKFIEESAKQLKSFQNRDLKGRKFVALFVDGKYLAKEQIVIGLGVTREGDKIPLDLVQTTTENAKAIGQVLKNLMNMLLGKSFSTTKCIENVNMLIERNLNKVKHWKTSGQRHWWVAVALLEIEPRMKKVKNYKKLPLLETALREEVLKRKIIKRKAA
ncbi:MAG: transposase [Bacteroidota bacterium]|nr:transposase [Bacteroidota bacterium]